MPDEVERTIALFQLRLGTSIVCFAQMFEQLHCAELSVHFKHLDIWDPRFRRGGGWTDFLSDKGGSFTRAGC